MSRKRGVENADVVDIVSAHPETGEWTLTMVETRPWCGEREQYAQLQTKVNNYLSYVYTGQLVRDYPEAQGRPVELHLSCAHSPSGEAQSVIDAISAAVTRATDLTFRMTVQRDSTGEDSSS
jgi:hypothetical protein